MDQLREVMMMSVIRISYEVPDTMYHVVSVLSIYSRHQAYEVCTIVRMRKQKLTGDR